MGDFHDDILAPSEMALIHDAMIGRFCWFEQVGRFSRYRSYETGGIQPQDPDKEDDGPKPTNSLSASFSNAWFAFARSTPSTPPQTEVTASSAWRSITETFRRRSDLTAPVVQP
jgi:hypothetical protein